MTEPPVVPPGWYGDLNEAMQQHRSHDEAAEGAGSLPTDARTWTTPPSVTLLNGLAVLWGVLAANALIVAVVERAQVGGAQAHDMTNCALGECGVKTSALVQTTATFALVIAGILGLAAIVAFVMAYNITDRAARDHAESHSSSAMIHVRDGGNRTWAP